MVLKAGDTFPEGVSFSYIPYTPEKGDIGSCGIPVNYDASAEFKNKKVVVIAVPGAFTPTCTERHVPSFIENVDKLKAKGVDQVLIIASNDAFVMSAWGKSFGVKGDYIIFLADGDIKFSKSIDWTKGERALRYGLVIDHGKVVYADTDDGTLAQTGADAILSRI